MEAADPIPLNVQRSPEVHLSPSGPAYAAPPDRPATSPRLSFDRPPNALLIPTDRPREELEDRILPRLGRLRVQGELILNGYILTCVRSWLLSRSSFLQTFATVNGKPKEQVGQGNSSIRKAYDADLSVRPWPDRCGSRRGGRGGEGDGAIGEGDAVQAAQGMSFIPHLRPSS